VKGSYVLLIKLPEAQTINIGSMIDVHFPRAYYAYVGSALGGVKARLSHHLKRNKRPHWHIDYLLQKATIADVIIGEAKGRTECAIAQALGFHFDSIPSFGSSDCHCHSHLFFITDRRQIEPAIEATLELLSIHQDRLEVRGHKDDRNCSNKTRGN